MMALVIRRRAFEFGMVQAVGPAVFLYIGVEALLGIELFAIWFDGRGELWLAGAAGGTRRGRSAARNRLGSDR